MPGSLAQAAQELSTSEVGGRAPEAGDEARAGDRRLFERTTGRDDEPVVRHLHHLAATLSQIAGTAPLPPSTVLAIVFGSFSWVVLPARCARKRGKHNT